MKSRLKNQVNNLYKPILAAIALGAVFLTYMYFIGIPKTKAAAYYEMALQQQGLRANAKANEYFKKAIESYPEEYIVRAYSEFKLSVL